MNWKCPNCGKRVAFSAEQLAETRGMVVCPQCLSSDCVPGYDAPPSKPSAKRQETRSEQRTANSYQPTARSDRQETRKDMPTPPPHKSRPVPPSHRPKINFADTSASRADSQPTRSPSHAGKKKKAKKSSSGFLAPKSSLGCLWRSVVYTLILLIVYIIFGLLLQGL